jgi:hypothetical protein
MTKRPDREHVVFRPPGDRMYWPLRQCPGEGCQNQIAASQRMCTACAMHAVSARERTSREEDARLARWAQEGIEALAAYLVNHARFADWLEQHPRAG